MKFQIKDNIFDYSADLQALNLNIQDISYNVKKHNVEVQVEKVPTVIIATFRYTLMKLIPTKRIKVEIGDFLSSDKNIILEDACKRIEQLYISSDCPTGKVEINYQNTDDSQNFIFVNSHMIKFSTVSANFAKYVNKQDLFPLGLTHNIIMKGEINEDISLNTNVFHDAIFNNMKRDFVQETDKDGMFTNSGKLEFQYMNNVDAKSLINQALNIMIEKLNYILNNLETVIQKVVTKYQLYIDNDRSECYANLIRYYICKNIKDFYKIDTRTEDYNSILIIDTYSKDQIIEFMRKSLAMAISDIKSLI